MAKEVKVDMSVKAKSDFGFNLPEDYRGKVQLIPVLSSSRMMVLLMQRLKCSFPGVVLSVWHKERGHSPLFLIHLIKGGRISVF